MNFAVPDETSVIGKDAIPFSSHIPVDLTTIRALIRELDRRAAEILIKNSESPEPLPIENVVLHAEFVIRESTRALAPIPASHHKEKTHVLS